MVPGPNFHLYVVIVGYTEYVSLNIKVGENWVFIGLDLSQNGDSWHISTPVLDFVWRISRNQFISIEMIDFQEALLKNLNIRWTR